MNPDIPKTPRTAHTGPLGTLNPQKILKLILRNWYIYLIAFIICGTAAVYYLKYKIPAYLTTSTILIEEEETMPGDDILQGFAVRSGIQNLDNQLVIITSYSVIKKVVDELPFEINVYRKGLFSKASYYPMSPLRIEPGPGGMPYGIELVFNYVEDDKFRISTTSKDVPILDTLFTFGRSLQYGDKSFTIFPQPELSNVYQTGKNIYIRFSDKEMLTENYMGRLQVGLADIDGSIIELSLEGTNKTKDIVFLNKLTDIYIENNLNKKNIEADRIIAFIDDQLVGVKKDLNITEIQLQEFRSRNRIMDVSVQAQQIVNQAVVLENEKANLNLIRNYYVYLQDYLAKDGNNEVPISPSSMGIIDPMLTSLMQELAGLQAEYFSRAVGDRNPLQGQLELRIRNTKQSMKETLSGIMQANRMAINENQQQINRLNSDAASLPEKERKLLGFERSFNLNNVLYTFLLERRAEAQIQSASNSPDHELVDSARSRFVGPVPLIVYSFTFSLAVVLATILLMLFSSLLLLRITSEEDVEYITDIPIIAQFPHSRLSYYNIVLADPSSNISESFRSLRTRMEFFTKDIECPLIVISSSIPGEGKTFVSINLATIYSLMGVKTLLVGFDLRRPTLSENFELPDDHGATDFLIGRKKLDEVIYESGHENLDILPSGSIPPNPAELSSSENAKKIFTSLKKKYNCIIVDSPPVGVVSDIYAVATMADAMLMVVRHGHTKKNALSATLSDLESYDIDGIGILINDVKLSSRSYKYNYKYKYEYKSVKNSEEKKSGSFLSHIMKLGKEKKTD